MTLTADQIGHRVVVRRRIAAPGDRERFSDVLGELVELGESSLTVRRRDGELVVVDLAHVAAAKPVPPAATRRTSDRDVERIAALGWQGLEQTWLGGWLLRAGNGFTGRANSFLPLDPPDRPVLDALAFVTGWYAERGLPPRAQVPLPLAGDLDDELAAAGWLAYNPTRFLVAPIAAVLATCPARADLQPVTHEAVPGPEWLAGYQYRGLSLPDGAVSVLTNATAPTFASVRDSGGFIGVGRGVVDEGWLGVTAVTVTESARRGGLGRHLMRGLAEWAAELGARQIYLQVAEENAAAVAMYDALGFSTHHRYHYRVAPGQPVA
ncbi:MAG: GNAT family N-acetyltransferase [Actinomycetota bacterium]|nr:GNAT family N-acetyltransferase [Actinomycetota bacterium]